MKATTNVRNGRKNKNSSLKKREDRVIQEILQIEALETRMLLSGIGTGLNKKKVTFTDATGDQVTVAITGKGAFNIVLDGGASNNQDIQSIDLLSGNVGKTAANLSITVAPHRFTSGVTGVTPPMWSAGIVHVGLIDASSVDAKGNALAAPVTIAALGGIASNGAVLENINLPGTSVTSIAANPGESSRIDRIMTTVTGLMPTQYIPQAQFVDFGSITAASIGTLSLTGSSLSVGTGGTGAVSGNDFLGPINVTNALGTIRGTNALLGTVAAGVPHQVNITAGSLNNVNVLGVVAGGSITTTSGDLTLNIGTSGVGAGEIVNAGGNLILGSVNGGVAGAYFNAGKMVEGLGSTATVAAPLTLTAGFAGTIHAGTGIAAINVTGNPATPGFGALAGNFISDSGDIGAITISNVAPGAVGLGGTVHAINGNVGAITTTGIIAANIISDQGNIGAITANQISGSFINAPSTVAGKGIIGAINVHTASSTTAAVGSVPAAIYKSVIHAGTQITSITAQNDTAGIVGGVAGGILNVGNGIGIANSNIRSDGAFGAINVSATGGVGAVGVQDSIFTAGGNFTDVINVSAGAAGGAMKTGDAIYSTGAGLTIFSTVGSFQKAVTIKGNVDGSIAPLTAGANTGVLFLAGYDVGADGAITGPVSPTDDVMALPTATVTVTSFAVSGNVNGLTIAAGISPTDGNFDGFGLGVNDTLNVTDPTHSTIGSYKVTGSTVGSLVEAGTAVPLSQLVTQGQAFWDNQVTAFSGNIQDFTISGSFANTTPFGGNTLNALQGSVGNIYVVNTSAIGGDAIGLSPISGAGNVINAKNGVGDIVGITAGIGSGINKLTVVGNKWGGNGSVGSVIGVATTSVGVDGIGGGNATAITGNNVGKAALAATTAPFLTANLSAADNTAVTALLGAGGIVGLTNGTGGLTPVTIHGLDGVTVNAQGNIGNIGGSAISTSATGNHFGISGFGAASAFNAGLGGNGTIDNIVATATATGATNVNITADAVNAVGFTAGGFAAGASSIGTVTLNATATTTGAGKTATADGFFNGSSLNVALATGGNGTISDIVVNATANAGGTATASGIDGSVSANILASNGDGGTGTIGKITSIAQATSTAGQANAWGINGATIAAGVGAGTETGSIAAGGAVTGTAKAIAVVTQAHAFGITGGTTITAGTNVGGKGTIGDLAGNATASITGSGTVNATAQGLSGNATVNGNVGTSIGNVTGTADAQASTSGTGANATSVAQAITGTNLLAGTGGATSTGLITSVTGTVTNSIANSTGTGGGFASATGNGIDTTTIYANHTGLGTGSVGSIQGLVATGATNSKLTATSASGNATVIGNGIMSLTVGAGDGGLTASGSIGTIIGTVGSATVTPTATAAQTTGSVANLQVFGINQTGQVINAGSVASVATTNAIGAITGTAYGLANGAGVNAGAVLGTDGVYGIYGLSATVDGKDATTGVTIGAVTGSATVTGGSAPTSVGADTVVVNGYGIAGVTTLTAGTAVGGFGTVTSVSGTSSVAATGTGTNIGNTVTAVGFGIGDATPSAIAINANVNGKGAVGAISGTVTALSATAAALDNTVAGGALASITGKGIESLTVNSGSTAATGSGTIGIVTGTVGSAGTKATVTATNAGATGTLIGLDIVTLNAGNTTGSIATATGGITGTVFGTLSEVTDAGAAGLNGTGINTLNVTAAASINGKTGTIGAVTGNATLAATATGTGKTATAVLYNPIATAIGNGINTANLNASASATIAGAGAGTVGTVGAVMGKATVGGVANGTLLVGQHNLVVATGTGVTGLTTHAADTAAQKFQGVVGAIEGDATITGTVDATAAGSNATLTGNGLLSSAVTSGDTTATFANSTGSTIGNVTATVTLTPTGLASVGSTGAGIGNGVANNVTIISGTDIGNISASLTGKNGLSAINGATFRADTGKISGLSAVGNQTADNAINNSIFTAYTSIANASTITVTGGVNTSLIAAGYLATNVTGVADNAAAAIGGLTTSGGFTASDLVASIDSGAGNLNNAAGTFGTAGDANHAAGTGTIGAVTIGAASGGWAGAGAHNYAIEAHVFAGATDVTINLVAAAGGGAAGAWTPNDAITNGGADAVRVKLL